MKKLISVLLAAMLLFSCSIVSAEDVFVKREKWKDELAQMTDDELYDFYIELQIHCYGRGLFLHEGTWLYPGVYEIGVDIPEGNYFFSAINESVPASVYVYPSSDNMGVFDAQQYADGIGFGDAAAIPQTGKFILKEGNILRIAQGFVQLCQWKGLEP